MGIDYKKELEAAAKSMILVHEPDLLIKMIVRLVVQKVQVSHAGILLHHPEQNTYVLTVSRGPLGLKVPAGFARLDIDNPLIRFFREHKERLLFNHEAFVYTEAEHALKKNKNISPEIRTLLEQVLYQLDIFDVAVCIPSFFREDLVGILFLGKKKNKRRFEQDELAFFSALTSDVAMAMRNARLFKQLQDELDKRQKLFMNTTVALAAAVEAKDRYTHGHTERVTHYSVEIAKTVIQEQSINLADKFYEDLHIAALLHDIGKIGIPENILNKEGPLTPEEWKKMQTHPVIGANILHSIGELGNAILGVKYHHERYDGKGYPDGLREENIPLIAAIIAVADSFDAMTTDRPYRKAKDKQEALQEIKSLACQQFNPNIVAAFTKAYQEGRI
ncbi:MAG: HD domain-containing phosphohydrolase [Candidatus Omnitrophota bacterium]|jgi:HD-GYP domain-containing protein (c-di-GMP phosphodiesterase class II)